MLVCGYMPGTVRRGVHRASAPAAGRARDDQEAGAVVVGGEDGAAGALAAPPIGRTDSSSRAEP